MTSSCCERCGSWGLCRCEEAAALEKYLRDIKGMLFLAVQRLGGRVLFTDDELMALDPASEVVTHSDHVMGTLTVRCRKPKRPVAEQAADIRVIRPPEGDQVNVGELLAEVATACSHAGYTLAGGGDPRESGAAFQRLGKVLGAASKAFAHIQLSVPKEPTSGS